MGTLTLVQSLYNALAICVKKVLMKSGETREYKNLEKCLNEKRINVFVGTTVPGQLIVF